MGRKKLICVAAAVATALLMSGCITYDYGTGVAKYVSPERFGGDTVVPASAPSESLGEKVFYSDTELSDTVYTVNATYEIKENYFIHEEFRFAIPNAWKEHLGYTAGVIDIMGHEIRTMDFSYVTEGTDESGAPAEISVKFMQIESVDTSLLSEIDIFAQKNLVGQSKDGTHSYYVTYYETLIPSGESYSADCISILGTMMSERGRIEITV